MSWVNQPLGEGQEVTLNFDMIPSYPTAEQQAVIDATFLKGNHQGPPSIEAIPTGEEGFLTSNLQEVPATIRVLMPDGTVVIMEMEEYLKGVVAAEVPPNWPPEALKAQAVAARSYASFCTTHPRHPAEGADVCTTTHCQAWSPVHYETTDRAVEETRGIAATYQSGIIEALYSAHCDGHTRSAAEVWGWDIPYLRSVSCICGFTTLQGHGVGMCQYGARAMAAEGASFEEILHHYYTDTGLTAPPVPLLSEGSVVPLEGDTSTPFRYEVTYSDDGDDLPRETFLIIDGYSRQMQRDTTHPIPNPRYVYTTTLPAGQHEYAFEFEDRFGRPARLPSEGYFTGPVVTTRPTSLPSPTPTATPRPAETRVDYWSQTTAADWAAGTFVNTVSEDGAIRLAPSSLSGTYTSSIQTMATPFNAVGSIWNIAEPQGTDFRLEIRARPMDGAWSSWIPVGPCDLGEEGAGNTYGNLIVVRGQEIQYRLTLTSSVLGESPIVSSLVLICIDSSRGPTTEEARQRTLASSPTEGPLIIPRSAWGADETWMTRPPEYRAPRTFIIHHTATANDDPDPAATVRAIYYYHAVTLNWGDIGYNYLIDQHGNIYEGRYGGEGVVGMHARRYNWGSIGIALLGDYEEAPVPMATQDSLIQLLAWKGTEHFIHPQRDIFFIDTILPTIMGHRDCIPSTICPGQYAYDLLPTIRQQTMNMMRIIPPNILIVSPEDQSKVSGVVPVSVTTSAGVTCTNFYLDGEIENSNTEPPFLWKWNTGGMTGTHQIRVEGVVASGLTATHTITVTVDNEPPTGTFDAPLFTNSPEIQLSLSSDATRVQFSNGWLWEAEDVYSAFHQPGTGIAIPDHTALNGWAWLGRANVDVPGHWYGPYFCNLPIGRGYRAYFRLKIGTNTTGEEVATLDVVDTEGTRRLGPSRSLDPDDFIATHRYQETPLDFYYGDKGTTCTDPAHNDGVELRTWFCSTVDTYVDRFCIFTADEPLSAYKNWTLPQSEGAHEVLVRFLDDAGNCSPVYSRTVFLDFTAPQWYTYTQGTVWVQDALSGLDVSTAKYAFSWDNGSSWSDWLPATVTATMGTTEIIPLKANESEATHLRFRILDRANNLGESPIYGTQLTATPSPTWSPVPTPVATVPSVTPTPTRLATMPTPTETLTALPTPALTPTQTPTAGPTLLLLPLLLKNYAPPPVINNGDFEHGLDGWEFSGALGVSTSGDGSHRGDYAALLGSPDYPCDPAPAGEARLSQRITVPAEGIPLLNFWYRIVTYDRNQTLEDTRDFLDVEVGGVQVLRAMRIQGAYGCHLPPEDMGWRRGEADLSAWRGQEIEIRFVLHTDDSANTWVYIDDVGVR